MQVPRAVPVSAFGRPAAQDLQPGLFVAGVQLLQGVTTVWPRSGHSPYLDTIVITGGQNRVCKPPINRHNKRL